MECPSCGEEVEGGSQFCRFCGEELVIPPDSTDLKSELQSMDDYEFEHFVADLWEKMGWDCEVSTASNDKGIDVRAKKVKPYEQKVLIQAKRYGKGNKVGSPAIQQYSSLKHQENNVDKVVVVTTSSYSRNAVDLADDLNVKLIDGDDLISIVEEEDAHELVAEYIDFGSAALNEEPAESSSPSSIETESELDWQDSSRTAPGISPSPKTSSEEVSDVQLTEMSFGELREAADTYLSYINWGRTTVYCTAGLWLVFLMMETLPSSIIDPLLLGFWMGVPICIYRDSQVTREAMQWPRWRILYVAAALVPGLGLIVGPLYLIIRYAVQEGYIGSKHTSSDKSERVAGTNSNETDPLTTTDNLAAEFGIDHYTDATDHIKQLKREEEHDTAEELLLWCIDQAENEAREKGYSEVPPWYYRHLGIIYRKEGRYADEKAILEQYVDACNALGGKPREDMVDRLDRAQQLSLRE